MRSAGIGDETVRLREWELGDAAWYAATARHDDLIQRFTTEPATLTEELVRAAIVDLRNAPEGLAGFLIADAARGERLGNIALSHRDGVGEVSYWLAAHARGRGVATRALRMISDWAFNIVGLTELRLWTHVENRTSRAVADRAGYTRDPGRDKRVCVKGQAWSIVAYVRHQEPSSGLVTDLPTRVDPDR